MPQAPAAPAFGQLAQGLGGGAVSLELVAKTDSCFSSAVEWHCGHSGTVSDRTRVSKLWPQSLQAYS